MRLLLDTCVIIDWLTDPHSIGDEVWDIINEPGCKLYVSAETARELIVSFNNKKLLSKYWKTAEEMLVAMKEEAMVDILPISERTMFTYSRLTLRSNLFACYRRDARTRLKTTATPATTSSLLMPSPSILHSFPATRSLLSIAARDSTFWNTNHTKITSSNYATQRDVK